MARLVVIQPLSPKELQSGLDGLCMFDGDVDPQDGIFDDTDDFFHPPPLPGVIQVEEVEVTEPEAESSPALGRTQRWHSNVQECTSEDISPAEPPPVRKNPKKRSGRPRVRGPDNTEGGGSGKFQCELCPFSYKQNSNLSRHRRNKHGHRKTTCPICGVQLKRADYLKGHLKKHVTDP